MSGFLLDTNVISLISPLRQQPATEFAVWLEKQERVSSLYLSAVTIQEISRGIHLLRGRGARAKAGAIGMFLEGLVAGYGDRILPLDAEVAREAGRLEADAISKGFNPGAADAMIAGTASCRGLTVITGNLRHFLPFGIPVLSPEQARLT